MATEVPREKLKELMEKNGDSLLQDRDRCEGLLKDYCGGHRREISALVGALEERVPLELKSSWQTAMTPEAMRARLVQRLEDNRGLAPEIANYAVDTWSYALGVGLGRSSDRVQDVPAATLNGFATRRIGCRTSCGRPPGGLRSGRGPGGPTGCGQGRHEQSEQGGRGWRGFAGGGRGSLCPSAPSPAARRLQWSIHRCRMGRTGSMGRTDKTDATGAEWAERRRGRTTCLRFRTGRTRLPRCRTTSQA